MMRDKCALNIKYSRTNYISVTHNAYFFTTTWLVLPYSYLGRSSGAKVFMTQTYVISSDGQQQPVNVVRFNC